MRKTRMELYFKSAPVFMLENPDRVDKELMRLQKPLEIKN
jgi:hypothetical protein